MCLLFISQVLLLVLFWFPGSRSGSSCSCRCSSSRQPLARVYGGTEAGETERPFQARLIYGDVSKCGGSIYNSLHILTAAHCIKNKGPLGELGVYVGRTVTPASLADPSAQSLPVASIFVAPLWALGKAGWDIGIIRLGAPIEYSKRVQPLPVVAPGLNLTGKIGIVSGWGMMQLGRGEEVLGEATEPLLPTNLQKASGTILSRSGCIEMIKKYNKKIEGTRYMTADIPRRYSDGKIVQFYQSLCVAGQDGRGACGGDSGGPLTCQEYSNDGANPTKLCGIVSSGYGCGYDVPAVYTEVNNPEAIKWIVDNAGLPDTPTIQY